MILKDLKSFLDKLTEKQLEGNLVANGNYTSGIVHEIKPSKTNLYYLGNDDPIELLNEDEMKQRLEEEGDTVMPKPYINKGEFLLNF